MQQHQPSNFATYSDASGAAVFDTFFILADWGNGDELFAFRSPSDREKALDAFKAKGHSCQAVSHQDAFHRCQIGTRAWIHNGDMPKDCIWAPLFLHHRTACVA